WGSLRLLPSGPDRVGEALARANLSSSDIVPPQGPRKPGAARALRSDSAQRAVAFSTARLNRVMSGTGLRRRTVGARSVFHTRPIFIRGIGHDDSPKGLQWPVLPSPR